MERIRQPIVTVCGHVDHGKTSLLDKIRQSSVAQGEAGGITQKISFTLYPMEKLKKAFPLIEKSKIKLDIPGFLFIDTPGHAAFTNLRKRGGSLADLAVLVIDVNEGIKPQTAEVLQLLKMNKTPFIIALNKIDNISGWRSDKNIGVKESIETQPKTIKLTFDERYMTLIGALNSHNFSADLFYNISDFTKQIALVPCSARTGQGIQELIMVLCGLSQKYLEKRLTLGKSAKVVILEVKKDSANRYAEAILYDGTLKKDEEIAVSSMEGKAIISKMRTLEEIQPLSNKFKTKDSVTASTGIRMQLIEKEEILPGMPFLSFEGNEKSIEEQFKKELTEVIKTEKQGIIAKADSLGSLEALLALLRQEKIPVVKAGIGNINKQDVASAKANLEINKLDAIIVGFNVEIDEEASELAKNTQEIRIITEEVVYKLIDNLSEFRKAKTDEIEKERLLGLATICKLKILHQYVFRNTKPAIFGVRVEGGKAKQDIRMIDEAGSEIGKIKNMQSENKSVEEAEEGTELAISVPGINFERVLRDKQFLYSDLGESQFKNFKKNKDLLSGKEIQILQEIAEIKRKEKNEWGK